MKHHGFPTSDILDIDNIIVFVFSVAFQHRHVTNCSLIILISPSIVTVSFQFLSVRHIFNKS